ncbi:cysteine-rich motor neuron 1 protein-like [Crassostrea virginica]
MRPIVFLLCTAVCAVLASDPGPRGMCLSLCGPSGVECPSGYECRSNGCGHECFRPANYVVPEGCSPVHCRLYCPLGFKVDESGCEICECNDSALSASTSGQIL